MSASRSCVVPRSRVFFESGWARVCLAQSIAQHHAATICSVRRVGVASSRVA